MPLYAYRCRGCNGVSEELTAVGAAADAIVCSHCGATDTYRIIGAAAYLTSDEQKSARLDPKYDRMIDRAMNNTRNAYPNRFLRHLGKPRRR